MTTEERSIGHVGADVYFYWAKAASGLWVPFAIVLVYGAVEVVSVASKWWLTYWSQHGSDADQMYFLGIYALINFVNVLAIFFRIIFVMFLGLRASRKVRLGVVFLVRRCVEKVFILTRSVISKDVFRLAPSRHAGSDVLLRYDSNRPNHQSFFSGHVHGRQPVDDRLEKLPYDNHECR